MVLMFYAIVLTIVAALGAAILGITAYLLTRSSVKCRKRVILASILFPFLCVAFAGVWFIAYAFINSEVFNRDPMLGDTWETPLPNGYALMMIDTTDQGTVYNPKTQPGNGLVMGRDDAVFGVRQMQVSKQFVFGARDSGYFSRIGQDSKTVDAFFELDTAQNTHVEFKSLEELRKSAAKRGVQIHLREFQAVFGDYRTTWFDYLAGAVLVLLPTTSFFVLAYWIWMVRKNSSFLPAPP